MRKGNITYLDALLELKPHLQGKEVKTITFQVTEDCNLKCSYCYQINKNKNYLNFEIAKKVIDNLMTDRLNPESPYYQEQVVGIILEFIGGEPFLQIDLISQICDYFESQIYQYPDCPWTTNHRYNFSSNGTLYFTDKVQTFIKEKDPFLSIGITVDGDKILHDSCRKFENGEGSYDIAIQAALAELERVSIGPTKITISPENIIFLADGITNLFSLGFYHIAGNCVFEKGWELSHAKELYKQLIKIADWLIKNNLEEKIYFSFFDPVKYTFCTTLDDAHCGVSQHGMLAVDYQGFLYPCIRFMKSSLGNNIDPLKIGDIENWIGKTKEYKNNLELLKTLTIRNMSPKKCLECPISSGCNWCTGLCYQEGDISSRTTYTCEMHQAAALAARYFYKKINNEIYKNISLRKKEDCLKIISQEEYNFLQ